MKPLKVYPNLKFLLFLILPQLLLMGCKSQTGEGANANSMAIEAAKCSSEDTDEETNSSCVADKPSPPRLIGLGEVPLSLERTPLIQWSANRDNHLQILETEIQIQRASDQAVVYRWSAITGLYVEGLNLTEGEEYILKLRAIDGKGRKSNVTTSEKWKARLGKGNWAAISNVNAPSPREFFSSVWTGRAVCLSAEEKQILEVFTTLRPTRGLGQI